MNGWTDGHTEGKNTKVKVFKISLNSHNQNPSLSDF